MKLAIFDIDGVLIRGKSAISHAADTIKMLKDKGILVQYLTNNSTQVREVFASRLRAIGIEASPEDVMTSSIASASYLKDISPEGGRILVVGEEGIVLALRDAGFDVVDYKDSQPVNFVVVGMDRQFTYDKLARAQHEIYSNKAGFIATNYDPVFPVENGGIKPGGGIMVRALEACTFQDAKVIGKPETTSIEIILKNHGIESTDAMIIGDNLETDILAGKRASLRTVFVLTGIHTNEDLVKVDKNGVPDYVIKDLSSLVDCLD
ncbi:MAG: HAD-IIA family hydrolase [bacterium]